MANSDNITEYILRLGGDDSELKQILAAFKSRIRADVTEIEGITSKLNLFGDIQTKVKAASDAFFKARDAADALRQQIDRIRAEGGDVGKDLVDRLKALEQQVKTTSREFNRQSDSMAKVGADLTKTGVDTKNLTTEQARLEKQLKDTTAAAAQQSAKDLLGFKGLADVKPQIDAATAAFNTLRTNGKLSAQEIAIAQGLLRDRIAEVRATVSGASASFGGFGSILGSIPARVLGASAGFAGFVTAIHAAITATHEFENALTKVGTVTNLSREQLNQFGKDAAAVGVAIGAGPTEALKQVFELLRSGVPRDNVLDVLRQSGVAASASMAELGDGVKATNTILSAFNVPVSKLGAALDVVVASAKTGGPTLGEFASTASGLGNAAQAAGLSFADVNAALNLMTNASGNAAESASVLARIIANLDKPEVRLALREMNVDTSTLASTFAGLNARGLRIQELTDLGVVSGRSATALAALTNNASKLPEKFAELNQAGGTAQKQLENTFDSPSERAKRFNAELDRLKVNFGETFGTGSFIGTVATGALNALNQQFDGTALAAAGASENAQAFVLSLDNVPGAANAAAAASKNYEEASKALAEELGKLDLAISKSNADLAAIATDIQKQAQQIKDLALQQISDIEQRAKSEIAALDRSKEAFAATEAATLEIQQQSAADRLKVAQALESSLLLATTLAAAQRKEVLKRSGADEAAIAAEVSKIKLDGLRAVQAVFQKLYDDQVQIAQDAARKVSTIEQGRVDIARSIDDAIRRIRFQSLDDFGKEAEKRASIDRLLNEARQAAASGDEKQIEVAKQRLTEAIGIAETLKDTAVKGGRLVVEQTGASQTAVNELTKIQRESEKLFGNAGTAAKKGADEAKRALEPLAEKLGDIGKTIDAIAAVAATAIAIRVEADAASFKEVNSQLNALTRQRTVNILAATDIGVPPQVGQERPGFNRGGYVDRGVQGFAAGGYAGFKVPGIGDRDSVFATLKEGSFVVRKAASQKYGDDLMGALAGLQRFAVGGIAQRVLGSDNARGLGGSGHFVDYPNPDWVNNWTIPDFANETEGQKIAALKSEAQQFFAYLLEFGAGLPHSPFGDLTTYIRDVARLIQESTNRGEIERGLAAMKERADSFVTTFRAAQAFGVPAAAPLNVEGSFDLRAGKASDAFSKLGLNTLIRALTAQFDSSGRQTNAFSPFARGGKVGDSVPALLTPGEWVIPPRAASALGSRFLEALNGARLSMPVQRFAEGGPVPGASIPVRGTMTSVGGSTYELHFHGVDISDTNAIRRAFAPVFRDIERRSRK